MKKKDPTSHRIIEKRRRDRMNNCLADLSKLIPSHYLKKGRGRIEKTEIIEMAIKHLKDLIESNAQQQQLQQNKCVVSSSSPSHTNSCNCNGTLGDGGTSSYTSGCGSSCSNMSSSCSSRSSSSSSSCSSSSSSSSSRCSNSGSTRSNSSSCSSNNINSSLSSINANVTTLTTIGGCYACGSIVFEGRVVNGLREDTSKASTRFLSTPNVSKSPDSSMSRQLNGNDNENYGNVTRSSASAWYKKAWLVRSFSHPP